MDMDLLSENQNCFLVRRSNKPQSATFNSLGILREDSILSEDIPDLSLNLLGGYFDLSHIDFIPKKKGMKPWTGEVVYFIDYKDSFETQPGCSPIFFAVNALNNKTFPYYREDPEAKKLAAALNIKPGDKGKAYEFHCSTRILHSPNNLNYWHVEFVLFDAAQKRVKRSPGSKWIKSASEMALGQLISIKAFAEQPELDKITDLYYINSEYGIFSRMFYSRFPFN